MNTQAGSPGPLPATLVLTGTNETIIPSTEVSTIPLSIQLAPDTAIEQTPFDVWASGYVKTTASGNITLKLYEGTSDSVVSGNLMGSSGAIAQASATAAFWIHMEGIFDSVSGVLAGKIEFYVNKTLVAAVTLSNFLTGFLNAGNPSANPPTVAKLPSFTLSATSSGAASGTPTTVNVQKFSCG
jgi:hypothetical protein